MKFMFKKYLAANESRFASLNLQLFNDGEEPIEPTEPVETTEPIDNDIEPTEPSEPVEPTNEPTEPSEPQDITQTQAFSRRLNEEREKIRLEAETAAVDRYIAKQYEGQLWNGKPILSQADLNQALYEQQLQQATNDPEEIQKLINEHPAVKAAREAQEAQAQNQKLWNEWQELQQEHPEIKDFSQLPQEAYDIAKIKGIPLLDAYNRIHVKKIKLETEQETIRKINKNATSSPGSALNGNVVHKTKPVSEMTSEEFEAYREEVRKQKKEY
jgi:hypothetical protein